MGVRIRELSRSVDDRHAGHGLSTTQCVRILGLLVQRTVPFLELLYGSRTLQRGLGSGRGLVCLFAIDRESVFQGAQHGLLDAFSPFEWHRQHRNRGQHSRDDFLPAMQGHDPWQDAALGLVVSCDSVSRCHRDAAVLSLSDHAHFGSISRREFFRHASGRLRGALGALLLDLWASGGLHPCAPRLRDRLGSHSGLFAQADLWLPGHGCSDCLDFVYRPGRL